MLSTSLFDYELPDELIARYPAEKRGTSRMLVLDRTTGKAEPGSFENILNYLSSGDILVWNDTKVLKGRMYGRKMPDTENGARFELLLVSPENGDPGLWNVLLKPGKRAKAGTRVALCDADGKVNPHGDFFEVIEKRGDGYVVRFSDPDTTLMQERYGHIPLPPYIGRDAEDADAERYQTVYARHPGAVAAPTAGLHFTDEILEKARAKGVITLSLTLHVGPGTFKPVEVENAEEHQMHFEDFILPEETARVINEARKNGHKVMAVGTTTVRVLESCVQEDGTLIPRSGSTGIFLYPPYKPRAVDMLLTNFHLPKSTLIMLVSCFSSREHVLEAYELAKKEKFHFYSYGDCMLLK
ncbi:MAG: tRNA preQ1(34) S-adenosylmethionine ribosyltransferase-isomerase QueA [Lentisphaeria bacterium]|nr:tRNA preQ1(34) S-adenosylmethionine ribosyltransferase-isomerase QueA [Lentisphaeria bacterium]